MGIFKLGAMNSITRGATIAVCAAIATAGCELGGNLEELAKEIGNPDPELIEPGGRQITEGVFFDLRLDGTTADGAMVVARKRTSDESQLAILPFNGDDECSAGSVSRFFESVASVDDGATKLNARVAFLSSKDDAGRQTLRFTNFACEVDDVEIEGASAPISDSFASEPGYIVETDKSEIYFVSPWTLERRLIAKNAIKVSSKRAIFASGSNGKVMWTVESGELVVRDRTFDELYRGGQDIVRLAHSSGGAGGPMLALTLKDNSVVTAPASDLDERTERAQDACGARFNSGQNGRELVYYSPCSERRLVVHELETDKRRIYPSNIDRYRITGATKDGPAVMYLTESSGDVGVLWAKWGKEEPVKLAERGNLKLSRLSNSQEVSAIVDFVGKQGDLRRGKLGEKLKLVAEDVAYFTSFGLITDFDGMVGDLQRFNDEGELELLAKNIARSGIRVDNKLDRALFLTNFDGKAGKLTLLQPSGTRSMSDNVAPGAYQFGALLPMVTILSDLDSETNTATLRTHRTDRDQDIIISEGVSETIETAWPQEGMLYSVTTGDRAGIWFARAR